MLRFFVPAMEKEYLVWSCTKNMTQHVVGVRIGLRHARAVFNISIRLALTLFMSLAIP